LAVDSVLAQSAPVLEVIVVSDGCQDDLTDLERRDGRVRVIRQANAGVSVARNVGLAAARGTYVALLDDDDVAHPDRIARQQAVLDADPAIGLCHGGFRIIDGDGHPLPSPANRPLQYVDMLELNFPNLSTLLVRRSLVAEAGGFDPALTTGEDIDFFLRTAMRTTVGFVPHTVTDYRRHGSNTSTGVWDIYPILQKHRRWAQDQGRSDLVDAVDLGLRRIRRNASRAAFDEGRAARRRGDPVAMTRAFLVSLRRDRTFLPQVAWSHLSRNPAASPEGTMPGR
jgi:glycosyltransferase involved in cell wall biosynthesis